MKRIIALVVAVAMIAFVSSCSSCVASSGCDAAGVAYVKTINDSADVVLLGVSSKKTSCEWATLIQTIYGSGCTIKWQ